MGLQAYGRTLKAVLDFKYLGRVLIDSDEEWAGLDLKQEETETKTNGERWDNMERAAEERRGI